jgi:hypothetical protein
MSIGCLLKYLIVIYRDWGCRLCLFISRREEGRLTWRFPICWPPTQKAAHCVAFSQILNFLVHQVAAGADSSEPILDALPRDEASYASLFNPRVELLIALG